MMFTGDNSGGVLVSKKPLKMHYLSHSPYTRGHLCGSYGRLVTEDKEKVTCLVCRRILRAGLRWRVSD